MDTIFMNSENSRTSEYHVLVLKLTDKLDLITITINSKYLLQHGVKNLNYQMDHIQ